MIRKQVFIWMFLIWTVKSYAQNCGGFQSLNPSQSNQINALIPLLDSALKNENLNQIDSLNIELKSVFSSQGGIPEAIETYYPLVTNSNWVDENSTMSLAHLLIVRDSLVYANLWKVGKGMAPPAYQPNSIFLRALAEIAVGLLQIASQEPDQTRKLRYEKWAIEALIV